MGRVADLCQASGPVLTGTTVLTPTQVRSLLTRHGLAPRKSDGQNFLVDANTVTRIVGAAQLDDDDVVLEIGPGLGAMTLLLADTVRRVVAVEIDSGLVGALGEVLAGCDNVAVIHADAMTLDFDEVVGESARLVANLPYNVATPLLLHAMDAAAVTDAYVMVQKEVAQRWAAAVGDPLRAAVSVKLGLVADVVIDLVIPRTVFLPVPNVDSVMVRVTRRPDALPEDARRRVSRLVDVAFRQRRKTLRNNLRRTWGDEGVTALEAAGVDPTRRAETLEVVDFVRICNALGLLTGD